MKTYAAIMIVAFAIVSLMSDTAQARTWRHRPAARVHIARRVVVAPVYPILLPRTTTVISPNVVVGPFGRIHYIAPVQPIGAGFYIK
ncbi:MAG: hypothetical protein WD738_19710 [Pirellulales bacterium]